MKNIAATRKNLILSSLLFIVLAFFFAFYESIQTKPVEKDLANRIANISMTLDYLNQDDSKNASIQKLISYEALSNRLYSYFFMQNFRDYNETYLTLLDIEEEIIEQKNPAIPLSFFQNPEEIVKEKITTSYLLENSITINPNTLYAQEQIRSFIPLLILILLLFSIIRSSSIFLRDKQKYSLYMFFPHKYTIYYGKSILNSLIMVFYLYSISICSFLVFIKFIFQAEFADIPFSVWMNNSYMSLNMLEYIIYGACILSLLNLLVFSMCAFVNIFSNSQTLTAVIVTLLGYFPYVSASQRTLSGTYASLFYPFITVQEKGYFSFKKEMITPLTSIILIFLLSAALLSASLINYRRFNVD
ncbi:hypothetical protein ACWOB3_13860 [Enterococcus songbeiensis]